MTALIIIAIVTLFIALIVSSLLTQEDARLIATIQHTRIMQAETEAMIARTTATIARSAITIEQSARIAAIR